MTYHVSDKDKAIAVANTWANHIAHRDKVKVKFCRALIWNENGSITATFYYEKMEDIEIYFKEC